MKNIIKIIAIVLFIVLVGIQFIRPHRTNPPINPNETLENTAKVPNDVVAILKTSCKDCHSNETIYPWYSNVAPISWKLVEHIDEGRDVLNFSKWGTYSEQRKERKLKEICEQVKEREMPHNQYLWIHWNAKLSDEQIKMLCDWTKSETEIIRENSTQ